MAIPKELHKDVLVFDTETATLGDHVCEIGFSLFRDGQLIREWGTFIKPTIPIEAEASNVHHIYDSDVDEAPSFADVAWYIYNILNSADVHVAYNYQYDRKVLQNEFSRVNMNFPIRPMVDPFIFYKQYHKYNKGKTLVKAAEFYGIQYVGAHRAMNDSTVTGHLLFKMAATKTNFPKTLKGLISKQRQWIELQYLDFSKWLASKGEPPPDEPTYEYYEVQV